MATVRLTAAARAQLSHLNEPMLTRIHRLIDRLINWPDVSGVKWLRGDLSERARLRSGDYRLQFRVEGENIIIEKIGLRRDFYEE